MAALLEVCQKQRAMIKFFVAERGTPVTFTKDFHLFDPMKETLSGKHYDSD